MAVLRWNAKIAGDANASNFLNVQIRFKLIKYNPSVTCSDSFALSQSMLSFHSARKYLLLNVPVYLILKGS